MSFAPTMGLSMSTSKFHMEDKFSEDYVPRAFAGMQVGYDFSKKIGIGLSGQYVGKGYKAEFIDETPLEFKYDYIEVVPFVEYKAFPFLGAVLGPSFGFLREVSAKVDNEMVNAIFNFVDEKELGMMAGLKLYWKDLFFNLTFNRSLKPVSELTYTDENGNDAGTGKEFNKSFRLGVGYNFHLKKK